jgi:rhodanese-related sulfurtransferase
VAARPGLCDLEREDPAGRTGILICREGFSSVLAAAQLQEIGFEDATDVLGGVEAWKEVGLPLLRQANELAVELNEAVAR